MNRNNLVEPYMKTLRGLMELSVNQLLYVIDNTCSIGEAPCEDDDRSISCEDAYDTISFFDDNDDTILELRINRFSDLVIDVELSDELSEIED